jgi:4-hydroxyphenylpyruvate dioxygenase
LYRQNDINFLINHQAGSFAESFHKAHGPSICSAGFRVKDAQHAFKTAVERGAKPFRGDRSQLLGDYPAIMGIGDSIVYFIDRYKTETIYDTDFQLTNKNPIKGKGFLRVDHMTNNVPVGDMQKWCDFYEKVFNFTERRYFDIRGARTGLISKVMISPCGKIMIPVNEPSDEKSQIQEYINEYHGSGIQHVALLTANVCQSVASVKDAGVGFLDAPDSYFDLIPERVPNVSEPIDRLKKLRILVDGDDHGYLLQIFTKNIIGPIFFEVIERKGHDGFGEGNFQALFDAIERDQEARGVL